MKRPDPVYSRLIGLEMHVPAGVGAADFCYTPPLGNSLILLGFRMFLWCPVKGAFYGGFVYVMSGAGVPVAAGEIATRWTPVVPLSCSAKEGFNLRYCDHVELIYPMRRRYVKDEIRFGVTIENFYNQAWEGTVLFEISEG